MSKSELEFVELYDRATPKTREKVRQMLLTWTDQDNEQTDSGEKEQ